ncbi:MAG: hypothetical protein IPG50_39730 [Myxococcales bacterium]|nr:hypothetical protein [Myxococcales bacterium]
MLRTTLRVLSWPATLALLASPVACGALKNVPGADAIPGGAASCPDTSSAEAIAKYDFVGGFKLSAENATKLKVGLQSAIEIKAFADKVDADLKVACGGLAKDLGATGEFKTAEEACKAAGKAMGDVKAKLGGKASITLDVKPPVCSASMNAMADCAGKCDANIKPGSAKVECEPGKLSGSCDAKCEGSCDMKAAAKCDGSCSGSCDAQMKGSCSGKCNGKCDGKDSKGASCTGTCDGKCEGGSIQGECKGSCGGSCKLNASAKCEGTCTGKCSAEFKEPKCTGEVKPPEMSADCKAKCNVDVQAKAECTPAMVALRISGAADAKVAEQFKVSVEKHLPAILKVAIGIGENGAKMAGQVGELVGAVEGSVKGMVSGGGASGAMLGGKLAACVAAPFKGAIDASANLKANINVSVDVKASASGSASAGGKTG